jgi:O-antigen ligase
MIRVALLWFVVMALAVYAWRDWYKSLCGLILLMAVVEHPDMPKSMLGIQGLNPWNILLLVIILAWAVGRSHEGLVWDMPPLVSLLLLAYLGVVFVSFVRMMAAPTYLEVLPRSFLMSEYLVNSVKWVVPGLLLFDGCRSRSRFNLAIIAVLGVYVLLAAQVIRWMPIGEAFSGGDLKGRSAKILMNEVGYHRVNMSMILAGASWAILATLPLVKRRPLQCLVIGTSAAVMFAQALTGGRMGYVTWGALGLILGVLRWRKYLLLAPLVVILVVWAMPGVTERMLEGIVAPSVSMDPTQPLPVRLSDDPDDVDEYAVTAGRNIAWPFMIAKIAESPMVGYGRLAMIRTGLAGFLWETYGESFPHPHNAYLEMLLDNGIIGFVLVIPFYLLVVWRSVSLFREDPESPVFVCIGGMTCALVLALLIASFGSQTFYPREGAVGMWCAIGLMFRVWVQRRQAFALRSGAEPVQATAPPALHPALAPVHAPSISARRRQLEGT